MDEPIEDLYFNWLYAKVARKESYTPSNRYQSLLFYLHRTEFVWVLSGDDNRAEEGRNLRKEFLRVSNITVEEDWMDLTCSVLEMLIAFAQRAAYQTALTACEWFWIFMQNLDLSEITDSAYPARAHIIGPVVEDLIWRNYEYNGEGGLFPLTQPGSDQREVEIWYQFCEYLIDKDIA
jgi:hypothetical protein